jgi:hypothetical protein
MIDEYNCFEYSQFLFIGFAVLSCGIYIIRRSTVTKKVNPHPIATSRSRFLSIIILFEYSGNKASSSDVIKRIIAKIARNKPMSESESGKLMMINSQTDMLFLLLILVGRFLLLLLFFLTFEQEGMR